MIKLYVHPTHIPMSWREFCREFPANSIALDGYVRTGPRFNPRGPWANFNHHEEVSRLETRATCAQVLIALREGLFDAFKDEKGSPSAQLVVNDCDEDVCLTVFILRNHHLAADVMNPLLNRLVFMEDMLDTTAGSYPFPGDLGSLQELMWIFQPYHQFRVSGEIDKRDRERFSSIIDDVGRRIMAYLMGRSEKVELDTRYEVIGGGDGWTMTKEVGNNARIGIFADGIKAFVAVRESDDGRFVYTLGRTSLFIPFPIPKLLKVLNEAEGNKYDKWGGGDTIAGSPRVGGSKLSPDQVTKIIKGVLCSASVLV